MNKIFHGKKVKLLLLITACVAFFQFGIFVFQAKAAGLTSVSPTIVVPGDTIVILSGYGFGNYQEGRSIYFNNVRVNDYKYWSDNEIRVVAPNTKSDGSVLIKMCWSTNIITYTCSELYRTNFYLKPKISYISPSSAKAGDEISIYGYYFGDYGGSVTIGGVKAETTYWGSHWYYEKVVRARVPAGIQSGNADVTVTSSGGYASETNDRSKLGVTYSSLVSSNYSGPVSSASTSGSASGGSSSAGASGSSSDNLVITPSSMNVYQNNGKIISNSLPVDGQLISEYPVVKFEWLSPFSGVAIAGYFVEFTPKDSAEPSKTGRFLSDNFYRAYNFEPNKDYNLFIQAIGRDRKISEVQRFTYRFQQPLESIDQKLTERLKGRILLQTESAGEAWYVNPNDKKRYYLNDPADAFSIMNDFGVGISNADLIKIPTEGSAKAGDAKIVNRLKGKILLQVESRGEAWYVNPVDGKRYSLGSRENAFKVMRQLGLGITNDNLKKILVGAL